MLEKRKERKRKPGTLVWLTMSLGPALPGHITLGVLTCPWPFPGSEALHPCCALLSEACLHISTSPYPGAHLLQTPYEASSRVPPPPGAPHAVAPAPSREMNTPTHFPFCQLFSRPHTDALLCFYLSVCLFHSEYFFPSENSTQWLRYGYTMFNLPFGQKAACLTLQEVMLFHRAGDLLSLEAVKESWVQACFC